MICPVVKRHNHESPREYALFRSLHAHGGRARKDCMQEQSGDKQKLREALKKVWVEALLKRELCFSLLALLDLPVP